MYGPWIAQTAFDDIDKTLATIDKSLVERLPYSVKVTSGDETLWTKYHTAEQRSNQRVGVMHVDGNSQYRVSLNSY